MRAPCGHRVRTIPPPLITLQQRPTVLGILPPKTMGRPYPPHPLARRMLNALDMTETTPPVTLTGQGSERCERDWIEVVAVSHVKAGAAEWRVCTRVQVIIPGTGTEVARLLASSLGAREQRPSLAGARAWPLDFHALFCALIGCAPMKQRTLCGPNARLSQAKWS